MTLQRLVIESRGEEIVIRVLYRSKGDSNPNTKRRRREVEDLVRGGLQDALGSLEGGDVTMCGTSGFTQREDVLCTDREATSEGVHKKLAKGA
jgi:hypothetical protein